MPRSRAASFLFPLCFLSAFTISSFSLSAIERVSSRMIVDEPEQSSRRLCCTQSTSHESVNRIAPKRTELFNIAAVLFSWMNRS